MRKQIYYNGKETNYEVSDDGRVFNKNTQKELKGTFKRNEYQTVQLTIEKKPKDFLVHRLVAEAFCENPFNYPIVDHIDRDKYNNHASNLRWATESANAKNVVREKGKSNKTKYYLDALDSNWKETQYSGYYVSKNGDILNYRTKKLLCGHLRNGYKRIDIDGKSLSLHILIWETFNGPIPQNMVIDHIDGNRVNNNLSNLRMISQSENMKHVYSLGNGTQVKIKQYDKNGVFIKEYNSINEAAEENNILPGAIQGACNRFGASGGFFWIKENQDVTIEYILQNTKSGKPKRNYKAVYKYDENDILVKTYVSLQETCLNENIKRRALLKIIDSKKLYNGFKYST